MRTLLAIRQKFREPSFWEVIESFVLVAYARFAASRTLLQRLLACLTLFLDLEDLFCWCKRKNWFLWTMAAAQAFLDHGDEWGLTKYLRRGIYASISTWTHPQNSNQHENIHKLCDETGHPVLSFLETQWKLKQQHDQNFPKEGKPLYSKY